MKGDFSRVTFDARKHYSRVLMQQGRVTVDADPNEQADILLHYLRTLAADVIGPYAAPIVDGGFQLSADENGKLVIGKGRYYVDGILVENDEDCLYSDQPAYTADGETDDLLVKEMTEPTGKTFWVYLDVWERHVTWLDDPGIRELALGGPDTCTRSKVVWRVRAVESAAAVSSANEALTAKIAKQKKLVAALEAKLKAETNKKNADKLKKQLTQAKAALAKLEAAADGATAPAEKDCGKPLEDLVALGPCAMTARIEPGVVSEDPCVLSPEAAYRGAENHLYRVEIHAAGKAGTATFKWSRDNGSVVAAWTATSGNDLIVSSGIGFEEGCWVELLDEQTELLGQKGVLVQLAKVEGATLTVDPTTVPSADALAQPELKVNARVRRWDQAESGDVTLSDGAVPITETDGTTEAWIDLEDGIQVQFEPNGEYRTGDYWLIPARVALGPEGGISWPVDGEAPAPIEPHGVVHHYAPLGFVSWKGKQLAFDTCRCTFVPGSSCFTPPKDDG